MPIRFERREKIARFLDPRTDFQEVEVACEIRWDPLTGRTGRVAHVAGFQLAPPDLAPLIAASLTFCPFCPDKIMTITTKFPAEITPEGRFRRGEAVLFPNLAPYDEHSAVAAICQQHYVPMGQFSQTTLVDAFQVCLDYLRRLRSLPGTTYPLVFWNYLPASGGTQIHPHLQLFATDTPGNVVQDEMAASQRYYQEHGRVFWADLLEEEQRVGERFITQGQHSAWLTSFISQSVLADLLILFPGQYTLYDLSEAALAEFCRGLTQVLPALEARGIYSFNLGFFSGVAGREDTWLRARLSPRIYMTPRLWGSDTSALQQLYQEHFMVQTPETLAQQLREAITL